MLYLYNVHPKPPSTWLVYVYIIFCLPQGKRVPLRSDSLAQGGWGPLGVDRGNGDKKQNNWSTVYKRAGGQITVFGDVLDADDTKDCIGTGCYQVNKVFFEGAPTVNG